ncbi:hypothetical protein SAMN05192558_101657 [Actinokineospora alba]|uniref:Uncharacterized protein n=1 Tax=Actinokineospora alba TaxID=504798 RepID=A0A1H0G4W5_9PSEU|nr:hypothetical protein [Actinokineospora alba]TDP69758.1 hypothetical protein C8E96_5352 [Actinokineospora alba]SDI09385.1 hypothetical protein SAMN05421871_103214 [Actinokineospora alba]SDO01779.1 hypothetical protein SAMN05192558_101657 [Actinokineospora alba]
MPYVDALCTLLERLIRERQAEPDHPTDLLGEVVPQLRTVLAQAGHHDTPDPRAAAEPDNDTEVDPGAALAVVSAARAAQEHLASIERAAAAIARDSGITLRRLADAAGITERAAADRYKKPVSSGRT